MHDVQEGQQKDPMMGMRGGGRDCFVVVSYDFEYSTEDGKRVWMKEGEVLLLLAKTNNDWWQVRGISLRVVYRPFSHFCLLNVILQTR